MKGVSIFFSCRFMVQQQVLGRRIVNRHTSTMRKPSGLGVGPHENAGHQAWDRKLNGCRLTVTVGEHELVEKSVGISVL